MKLLFSIFFSITIVLNLHSADIIDFVPQSDYSQVLSTEVEESFDDDFMEDEVVEQCPFLENYNRTMTKHNDYIYTNIMQPISDGYKQITNEPVREGIDNFFYNIAFPIRFVNNLLQIQVIDAGEEVLVFAINTTIGIVGIYKPAQTAFGLQSHPEDFGQTLGVYGVGSGCHIVLPFFGPSNARDIVGMAVNSSFDATHYDHHNIIDNNYQTFGIKLFEKLNGSPKSLREYQLIKNDAIDLYPYLRDMYEQYRNQQIKE